MISKRVFTQNLILTIYILSFVTYILQNLVVSCFYVFFQNKKELESKLRAQSRTIDKLKKEVASLKSKKKSYSSDKENVNSPSPALNASHNDTLPLKERN